MSHTEDTAKSGGWIQHKVRPEVKAWIVQQAAANERSQGWIANRILEDAYTRAVAQASRQVDQQPKQEVVSNNSVSGNSRI